jgi:hypothetical protein
MQDTNNLRKSDVCFSSKELEKAGGPSALLVGPAVTLDCRYQSRDRPHGLSSPSNVEDVNPWWSRTSTLERCSSADGTSRLGWLALGT